MYRDRCQPRRVAWQAACSPAEAGSLENYLLKRRGAAVLGEPPSTQAGCAAAGAAGCAPAPRLGLRKRRADMINDGVTHVRACALTRLPGAERSA